MKPTIMKKTLTACLALIALIAAAAPAAAQLQPSSDLLLPWFEVDDSPAGVTTLFAVGNATDKPVEVVASVYTNWGVRILQVPFTLQAREIRTVNLRDWFKNGGAPNKALAALEIEHLAAAASGQRSPKDKLYYSTEVRPDTKVGYVTLRTQGKRPDALWGDWFLVDVSGNLAGGDVLVNIDRTVSCPGVCQRHLLRYLNGGGFDGGTELIIWRETVNAPSATPDPGYRLQADATAFNEPGLAIENRQLSLLPVETVQVRDLALKEPFGSLDFESEEETFIGVKHTAEGRYAVAYQTYCLPRSRKPGPGIEIVKLTNGVDANAAPGPSIPIGDPVTWEYLVTNIGSVALNDILVTDDKGVNVSCPGDTLAPGESMTCTGSGTAQACQYSNLGTATGSTASGSEVSDSDPSHYFGDDGSALSLGILLNGNPAGTAPGPQVANGSQLAWTFRITNTGDVRLTGIQLDGITASCPKSALNPGESMDCTASGTAPQAKGQHSLAVEASGQTSCSDASAAGTGYYQTPGDTSNPEPAIEIIKYTNGQDANLPPGPSIPVGSTVTWTYKVTNVGDLPLSNVTVTDDKGVAVSCPKTSLAIGEHMICTGSGVAEACQYSNLGTATGSSVNPPKTVTDSDPSHYLGTNSPAIQIETKVNGNDADSPTGPHVQAGSPVSFAYTVQNTGNTALTGVQVTDSKGVALSCPKTTLQAGESMTCTANGTAQSGQYSAVGTATGTANANKSCSQPVSDTDPVHYFGDPQEPGIEIVKLTNGHDANTAPGPQIPVGTAITWEYRVTNTGNVTLSNVQVSDDKGVAVSCPKTTLAAGETMICTGQGTAQACQYMNLGTATGKTPSNQTVTDSDPSHYYGTTSPAIQIETKVNGQDADTPTGPQVPAGSALSFVYQVKNTGNVALTGIQVTDSKGLSLACPKTTLQPNESMSCTASGTAQSGQYSAVGTATGTANGSTSCSQSVSDDDPVHYFGTTTTGDEGCTPGYWKNHTDSWPPTGYTTGQKVQSVFSQASLFPTLGNSNLLQALSFNGGSTLEGAAGILLRAATASLLNSAHSGVDYPWVTAQVISDVNAALASQDRDTMLGLANELDQDNNLGCPLN